MAEHGNMEAHEKTYSGVMNMMKWGTIVSVIVAAIVILLIAN